MESTRFGDRSTLGGLGTLLAVGVTLLVLAGSASATHDADGDLILEEQDNCPGVFNPDQFDHDADGRGSTCDDSPGATENLSHFTVYFRDQNGRQTPCANIRWTIFAGTEVFQTGESCTQLYTSSGVGEGWHVEIQQLSPPQGCTGGLTGTLTVSPALGSWQPATVTYRCGTAAPPPTGGPAIGTPTGTVLLNGRPFGGGPVPFGARVDVTKGTLRLVTGTGTIQVSGKGAVAIFALARGTDRGRPVTELRLAGGDFGVCKRAFAGVSAVSPPPKVVRHLWGKGKGRFRTRARYASATVRGTVWLTEDRCDGTLTRVTQGSVQVADLPQRKTVLVRAGKSYLAKRP